MMEVNEEPKRNSYIPEINSDSDVSLLDEIPEPVRQRKRVAYKVHEVFESKDAADAHLKEEGCWAAKKRIDTEEGEKQFFRCKKVKSRGEQCAASIHLLYEATSSRVYLFRSDAEHNCHEIDNKAGPSMTPDIKKLIEVLCDQQMKPLEIMDRLTMLKVYII